VSVIEKQAKSILLKRKRIDSWFVSRYGMNLYRGCMHNCVYCDGRAEGYYVSGEFGQDVEVKVNAAELLDKALNPKRKRIPLRPSYIMLGGGVGDCYQPLEEKYQLARQVLEVIEHYKFPVHVLTKSSLVERDLDLLKRINQQARVIVSMSFSSVSDEVSRVFEPGCSLPSRRLKTLALMKEQGFATGIFLMPVIPFVTDSIEMIDASLRQAKQAKVDFVNFSGMTLKHGRQRDYFMRVLDQHYPELVTQYDIIYTKDKWGRASSDYYRALSEVFSLVAKKYKINSRIPPRLYQNLLDQNDLVVVILESLDSLLRQQGRDSPYGYAAYSVSQLKQPISTIRHQLRRLKGVGQTTERIIKEILDTKTSSYLESLLI
jgi:DNA repair photolyase